MELLEQEREDEVRLVQRMFAGETRALEQFARAYRRFITSILSRQPNFCPDDVEELYQRFLLHIWEDGYRRLRPWSGTRSLRAYLAAVARNLARDYRRERRRTVCAAELRELNLDRLMDESVDDVEYASRRIGVVKSALGQLTDRDRDLLYRRYYRDESYREIAQALGMTVNHVGVALFRAESRLKNILQKHHRDL